MTGPSGGPAAPGPRGSLVLIESACTSCMLCVRECPTWCISLEAHTESADPAASGGGRPRTHLVLDEFSVDYGLCMYCGICVEVCPFDALEWSPEVDYAEADSSRLRHDKSRLAAGGDPAAAQDSGTA